MQKFFLMEIVNKIKEETLVFLDPPYYDKGPGLYTNFYKHNDHLNISEIIKNKLRKKWIVTYDNVEEIKQMYSQKNIIEYSLNYSAHRQYKGKEVFIYEDLKLPKRTIENLIYKITIIK